MQKEDDEFAASVAARRSADISRTTTPAAAEDMALIKSAEGRASEKGVGGRSEEEEGGGETKTAFTCGAPPMNFYMPTHGVPVTPVVLSWHDLGYEVHSGGEGSEVSAAAPFHMTLITAASVLIQLKCACCLAGTIWGTKCTPEEMVVVSDCCRSSTSEEVADSCSRK